MDKTILDQIRDEATEAKEVFDQWSDSQLKYMSDAQKQHKRFVQEQKDATRKLQDNFSRLEVEKIDQERTSRQQASDLALLSTDVDKLNYESTTLDARKRELREQLESLQKSAEKEREAIASHDKDMSLRMKELIKGVAFYKERLGLEFFKEKSSSLRFVFTNIDPDQLSREFVVSVCVDAADVYCIDVCEPMVNGLAAMVAELNRTNELSVFIKQLRRKFKEAL